MRDSLSRRRVYRRLSVFYLNGDSLIVYHREQRLAGSGGGGSFFVKVRFLGFQTEYWEMLQVLYGVDSE